MDFSRPDLARRAYTTLLCGVEDGWNANLLSGAAEALGAREAEIANALEEEMQGVDAEIVNRLRCAYMNMSAGMAAMRELRGNLSYLRNAEAQVTIADNPQVGELLEQTKRACNRLLDREATYSLEYLHELYEALGD